MPYISSRPVVVSEGDPFAEFIVRLDAPAANEVRVSVQTDNVTASYNEDYVFLRETLVFAPGETVKTVRVSLLNNVVAEGTEVFWLNLYSPIGATIEQPLVSGTIFDNDGTLGGGTLSINDVLVDEAAGTAQFVVSLSRPSSGTVTVAYSTANDDAQAGSDYTATSGNLSFAPGEMVKTVTVPITNDSTPERDEFFFVRLTSASGAAIADGEGSAMIGRNDDLDSNSPYAFITPIAADESNTFATFAVQLSAPSANVTSLTLQTDNVSASYNEDYVYMRQALTFLPGQTLKTIQLPLLGNTLAERTELLNINLYNAEGLTIPVQYTPIVLFDNDTTSGTATFAVTDALVDESAQTARFFVSLSRPSGSTVTVAYATADGTAAAGSDFQAASGLLSFAPGETAKTVIVKLIDDTVAEAAERFQLVLSNPVGASLVQTSATATIGRNDGAPTSAPMVTVEALPASESALALEFMVQLSSPSTNEVRITYQTDNATADYNQDHTYGRETLIFAPGETSKRVLVPLIDNSTAEPTELLWINLYNPVNARIPKQFTPLRIHDNDGTTGTPAVSVEGAVVDESADGARFTVSLNRPSTSPVTVSYATADDGAAAGSDYRATSGTLTFAPGEMVKTVIVDIFDDALAEGDEMLTLLLSAPGGATLATARASALIGRSDTETASQPYIIVTPAAASEGAATLNFTIQLSAPSENTVSVTLQTDNVTADYNQDHLYVRETVSFAPGQTTLQLQVPLLDNSTAEPTESLYLNLYNPVNGRIAAQYTPALIFDNDGTTGTPGVSVSDAVVEESAQLATFFVSLNRPSTQTVGIGWATGDDSALAGSDFIAASGSLSFAPGEMVKPVTIRLIDDGLTEGLESFLLRLSSPVNATVADAVGNGWIGRGDGPTVAQPRISVLPAAAVEGEPFMNFVLSLSAPSSNEVSVNMQTDTGSASQNTDYLFTRYTVVFAPGETSKLLRVPLLDDTAAESTETVTLRLSSPVNASLVQTTVTGTLADNDSGFTVLSHGLSHDLYNVSSALTRIVEAPGGGIDTVRATVAYTLPDQVENLVLLGSVASGIGNEGPNIFVGNAANNTFDGKGGIDTVVFSGPRAAYTSSGTLASRVISGGNDGSDTLLSIERLQFSDFVLANDTAPGENTYLAYAMFNAGFDRAPNASELAMWTHQLDRLGSTNALAQAMINFYAPGVSDEVLVAHLWGTIVETPIPLDALAQYVGLVGNGTYTQASLVEFVTTIDLNTVELVGIVNTGLLMDAAPFGVPG
jgi:hypothetical protein